MATWQQLEKDFHEFCSADPNTCANLGIEQHEGELPDPSLAAIASRLEVASELKTRIANCDRSTLSFDETLDCEIAELHLSKFIVKHKLRFNDHDEVEQLPRAGEDISAGIFMYFINDPREPAKRLDLIRERINKIPTYLERLLPRLKVVQGRWRKMDLEQVESLPDFFGNIINWAKDEGYSQLSDLERVVSTAATSLKDYAAKLSELPATEKISLGRESAAELVRSRGIDLPFEELHQIAKDFLAENARITEELRHKLVKKHGLDSEMTTPKLQEYLNQKFATKCEDRNEYSDILKRYQNEREKILAFISERDLFPVFKEQNLLILKTPKFMEPTIPAGAMMSPPPFRDGTKQSVVYLTLRDDILSEHTEISIPAMMIHEGIPGHHLHLAWAARHSSVVRRHVDYMDQAEGWTTMLEDYMLDVGYGGQLEDEIRFSTKRDIARIGARVAIDLFLMTGDKDYLAVGIDCDLSSDDPFVAAGSLLKAVTGFADGRVQAELNWYSQERGYPLSYLTGNYLTHKLKADVVKKRGGPGLEVDREFHKVFLETSNMPMKFVRRVFEQKGLV